MKKKAVPKPVRELVSEIKENAGQKRVLSKLRQLRKTHARWFWAIAGILAGAGAFYATSRLSKPNAQAVAVYAKSHPKLAAEVKTLEAATSPAPKNYRPVNRAMGAGKGPTTSGRATWKADQNRLYEKLVNGPQNWVKNFIKSPAPAQINRSKVPSSAPKSAKAMGNTRSQNAKPAKSSAKRNVFASVPFPPEFYNQAATTHKSIQRAAGFDGPPVTSNSPKNYRNAPMLFPIWANEFRAAKASVGKKSSSK